MPTSRPENTFCFESYGVGVRLESSSPAMLASAIQTARSALLGQIRETGHSVDQQVFKFQLENNERTISLIQNGENMVTDEPSPLFWRYFDSLVRILVADHAPKHVFLHSGVVGWKGGAIVLPGNSFYGKSTLVAELVKCGAEYYSDEYAVLDEKGLNHPFARPVSLRSGKPGIKETPTEVEALGGVRGATPIPVSCVLFTRFEPESRPDYQFLSTGQGILEIVPQTIAIRRNTHFAIKVLKKAISSAIIVKSPRPEASVFAREFLEFVDNTAI